MDQTGSHRIIHPAPLKWKTVFPEVIVAGVASSPWRCFKQSGGNTEFILSRSAVTSTGRCHHYREGVPDRIFHVPCSFFFPRVFNNVLVNLNSLVKIRFCFPRCSTPCPWRNSALAISAWACQAQLQPPWYSRSSSEAHTERRRKPKRRI